MAQPVRNKDLGKAGNPGQFASPGLNIGLAAQQDFDDPYAAAELPTYEQLRGRRTRIDHPTIAAISVAYDPRTADGDTPDYVEIAFFDRDNQWISHAPVADFEAWDEGLVGDTRVYPGVPFGYVQAWISADGKRPILEERVAAELHEEWCAGRAQLDGTNQPRWKDDGKGGQVDIANTPYQELPEQWKTENRDAAHSVVRHLLADPHAEDDDIAEKVHRDWVARNHQWAPPELLNDYSELPPDEQRKDRAVVWAARRTLGLYAD